MKTTISFLLPFLTCSWSAAVSADVIYSNLQDIAIPKDNTGVYLNVFSGTIGDPPFTGWHINPTFGGINVYNNSDFQPLRVTNSGTSTLSNIPAGGLIESVSNYFATGMGASGDHLGSTFTAGTEGYIGFSVVNGAATHYGWMRVVFTGTGDPKIRDWAYDNTNGGSIAAGNVLQSGSTYTLDSSTQSFTLGSTITGSNSVIKTGDNTATLSQANTYTGTTTVSQGTLLVNNTSGSGTGTAAVNVTSGILGGSGTISGPVTVSSGAIQTAGDSVTVANPSGSGTIDQVELTTGITYNQGSIFEWNLTADTATTIGTRGTNYDAVNTGSLATTGDKAIFRVVLNGDQNFDEAFWDADRIWADIFTNVAGDTAMNIASIFRSTVEYYNSTGEITNGNTTGRSFSISGTSLTWTAIPEPNTALAGLLLSAGMLRRRRRA